MDYKVLNSDITVSEIGFGAWGIGGYSDAATSYGATDDKVSIEALNYAYECGINFFDTSNVYGDGHSEKLIGRTFKKKRDEIVIATKFGLKDFNHALTLDAKHIRLSVEGSLKRLETDYIDLLQSHKISIDSFEKNSEILDCLKTLKKEGKIREFAFSTNSPQEALTILDEHGVNISQGNLNLLDMRFLQYSLDFPFQKTLFFIARTPFGFGFLAENLSTDKEFDKHDHRSLWSTEQRQTWIRAANQLLDTMECKDINSQKERCISALNFCLSVPYVKTVIPGILTKEHVDLNINACKKAKLNKEELRHLLSVYQNIEKQENGFIKRR